MNVFALLRQDHKTVSLLFQQIQDGFEKPDTPERHQLFRRLKDEMDLHAAVEDLHVYRVFQEAESTRDNAVAALEAHREIIKTLIDELEAASAYDHRWVPRFMDLGKLVEMHVALEENEMFRKAEAFMTPQEAEELGVTVQAAKQAIGRNAPTIEGGTPEQT
ncbi:MAG: hemerythrin domain-containing protein [Nitrospiraceae bacterium]